MNVQVRNEVFDLYPNLSIAGVIVREAKNSEMNEELASEFRKTAETAATELSDLQLSDIPEVKLWRQAYKAFGANKKHRSSLENMLKRLRSGNLPPSINPLVDIGNILSIEFRVPVGVEDLEALKGDLLLARAEGNEPFQMLGTEEIDHPKPGEVVYKDDEGVVCRCFNWRESERVSVKDTTTTALIAFEMIEEWSAEKVNLALNRLDALVTKYTGGSIEKFIVSNDSATLAINFGNEEGPQ